MAITPVIMNVHIVPPPGDAPPLGTWTAQPLLGIWTVRLGPEGTRDGAVLALCDTLHEAKAFVAALQLDGLLGRIGAQLSA